MATQNREQELSAIWAALADVEGQAGWRIMLIEDSDVCRIAAGYRFPTGDPAVRFSVRERPKHYKIATQLTNGFSISFEHDTVRGGGWTSITVQLVDKTRLDFFTKMMADVVTAVTIRTDSRDPEDIMLRRIDAWRRFMRESGDSPLSHEKMLGLIGELHVLSLFLEKSANVEKTLNAWIGPLAELHDFHFDRGDIEVKTSESPEGFIAKVESLDQLDPNSATKLVLVGVRLVRSPTGKTLPESILRIANFLDSFPEVLSLFNERLLLFGYSSIHDYGYGDRFNISETRSFIVDDKFPSLRRGSVPEQVVSAQYKIELGKLPCADTTEVLLLELEG